VKKRLRRGGRAGEGEAALQTRVRLKAGEANSNYRGGKPGNGKDEGHSFFQTRMFGEVYVYICLNMLLNNILCSKTFGRTKILRLFWSKVKFPPKNKCVRTFPLCCFGRTPHGVCGGVCVVVTVATNSKALN